MSRYMPAPQVQTIVIDLGNSCQCFGCRQKIIRVLNKLKGVIEYCYNVERNEIRVTGTVDRGILIRKLCRVKMHARVTACFPQLPPHQPFPPPDYANRPPPPQYPPPWCGQGQPPSGNNYAPALGPQHGPVQTHVDWPPPCCGQLPSGYHNTPVLGRHHGPVHTPADQPQPRYGLYNSNSIHGAPPPMKVPYCRDPPPSSAWHSPPPHHNCQPSHQNSVYHRNPPPNNSGADQLYNFLHGPSSPLIPRNVCSARGVLGQLANIKRLQNVLLVKKKGVNLRFEDGQVKSCHPTNYLECRPGYH